MYIVDTLSPIETQGTAVALGYFDGVHLGHRAVIGAAVRCAEEQGLESAVFTFSLPALGGFKGRHILSETEKCRRIASLGVHTLMCPPFELFAALSPEAFVRNVLAGALRAQAVFCGEDFTFGKDKAGDVAVLRTLCAACGIAVHLVPTAQWDGAVVSSTRIRAALAKGALDDANAMLAQDYSVTLPVRHGEAIGRTLGFPTLNQVYPAGMQLPGSGVYITEVTLEDGTRHAGATGLGTRPTVGGKDTTCETFMPGFVGDVYGESVTVRFCKYLKPTVKFDTMEQLRAYIADAARAATDYFAAAAPQT